MKHALVGSLALLLVSCVLADEGGQVRAGEGSLPIVLCAPHGGSPELVIPEVPKRRGEGVAQFNPLWDTNTHLILEAAVAELERRTGARPFFVLAQFNRKYCDANRPAERAFEHEGARLPYETYHAELREAVDALRAGWQQALLIDIHGQKSRPDVIWRGTRGGATAAGLLVGEDRLEGEQGLMTGLRARGYSTFPNSWEDAERPYGGGYTVATYGSTADDGIQAVQLEIGLEFRKGRERAVQTGTDLGAALADWLEQHAEFVRAR